MHEASGLEEFWKGDVLLMTNVFPRSLSYCVLGRSHAIEGILCEARELVDPEDNVYTPESKSAQAKN